MEDAQRFILEFRSILETTPLQIYISALVFSPNSSIIKRLFSYEIPSWIEGLPIVDETWPASLQTLEGHSTEIHQIEVSSDGQLLASAGQNDKTIRVWNTYTGGLIGMLNCPETRNRAMIFSAKGQLLISAFNEHMVTIWDPITKISQDVFEYQPVFVTARAFSSGGRLLASASLEESHIIRLWEPMTGRARGVLKGHVNVVRVIKFSPPIGQLVASGSEDTTVKVWDSSTGGCRLTLKGHPSAISAVAFSPPDGRLLASVAKKDFTIRLWDTSIGALKGLLHGHLQEIESIMFSPNGEFLVSLSSDNTTRLWDSATGVSTGIIDCDPRFYTDSGTCLTSSAFSPDGGLLAVSSVSDIQLRNPVTCALHSTLKGHLSFIEAIQFSPNGHLLATGSHDETIRLWDVATEASHKKPNGLSDTIFSIVLSPCYHMFASGSLDTIRLWDSATGALRCSLEVQSFSVKALAFSPDSQTLASGYSDGTLRLWDPAIGASRITLEGHKTEISALSFSPDGQTLASACESQTIILWDSATGSSRPRLKVSTWIRINSLAFSLDGRILASANVDEMTDQPYILLWAVSTCTPIGTIRGISAMVTAMIFSPDSRLLASASSDTTVSVWNTDTGSLVHQNTLYRGGNLSFNEQASALEISGRLVKISSPLEKSADDQVWNDTPYAIDATKEWITYKGCNVLRLPPNRRSRLYETFDKTLILGSESCFVTFFRFSSSIAPLCI